MSVPGHHRNGPRPTRGGRLAAVAAALAGVAVAAGCAEDGSQPAGPAGTAVVGTVSPTVSASDDAAPSPSATGAPTAAPRTPPADWPTRRASVVGGACHLLDYPTLYEHLGLVFDVAAARSRDDAHACVVRATAAPLPDLALTVVPTSTDAEGFELDLMPEEAEEVERLGRIAYLVEREPEGDRGPGLEIGWLSADDRVLTLALTLPPDTDEDPAAYAEGLLEVARTVDRRRI